MVSATVCIVALVAILGRARHRRSEHPARKPAGPPSLHRRRGLADGIELALDHRAAMRRGLWHAPAIPAANRSAVRAPLRASIVLLRDRSLVIDGSLETLGALALDPTSALYQPYPNRARLVAQAAFDDLEAAARPAAYPAAGAAGRRSRRLWGN